MIYDSTRNAYFDNAKAILITLVVLGHVIEPFIPYNYGLRTLFVFIYTFHMPAFALLSGYFSKHIQNLTRAEFKYLLLFLASTFLYWPLAGQNLVAMLVMPYFVLWYLVSLTSWYVLLQFFTKFKHPIAIAIIIAVIVGYIPLINEAASLSRTFVLFPFFLAGYYFTSVHFDWLKNRMNIIAIGILLAVFISIWLTDFNYRWIFNYCSYSVLGHPEWYAGLYRIGLMLIYALVIACFFVLVPRARQRMTVLGKYTLIIFLGHGPVMLFYYAYLSNRFPLP